MHGECAVCVLSGCALFVPGGCMVNVTCVHGVCDMCVHGVYLVAVCYFHCTLLLISLCCSVRLYYVFIHGKPNQ